VTPAEYGWAVQTTMLREWRELATYGYLTEPGLMAIRGRVDPTNNEFPSDPDVELTRLIINDAIARERNIDPVDLPGSPLAVPNTLEGLDE
jgi:hypothetical protein